MTDDQNKDIVEEVFSRSSDADDRVSALFTHLKQSPQVSVETDQTGPSDLNRSPAEKDTASSANKPFPSDKYANYEFLSKKTNKKMPNEKNDIAVLAGSIVLILVFIAGSYLRQHSNDSTNMIPEKQTSLNAQPGSDSGRISINSDPLLNQISPEILKAVQITSLERGDSSQLFLQGRALTADAVYDLLDALNANSNVELAEIDPIRIGMWNSQEVLFFSITCSLASHTKTPAI